MSNLSKLLLGQGILAEANSPFNGKIRVVRTLGLGTYIQVDGLTQSGGIIEEIWRSTLRQVHSTKRIVHSCLILGLGGGSAAKLIKKYWKDAKITGVDIDPAMVEMGKKYLGLSRREIEIEIEDAQQYLKSQISSLKSKFDLIIIDLYKGYEYPKKFGSERFLKSIVKLLCPSGTAVFNRLYMDNKRTLAMKFGRQLEKVFAKVEYFYPAANLMFICTN